ncbi:MAG: TSUP family transporter [Pseudomonadota bacterium]
MNFEVLSLSAYCLLFLTGFCAGFVDSIAGGGGLISLPALLFAGLPPQVALGTNKFQGTFGALSAALNFIQKGQVSLKEPRTWAGIGLTFLGALSGAWAIQRLDPSIIRHLIPVMLFMVFVYTLVSGNLGLTEQKAKLPSTLFYLVFGLGLGFYDGFFGPGTGSFWTAAYMVFMGFSMTRAAGHTRIMNFASNIVALIVFIIGGKVVFSVGLCMAAGQILGARAGSGLAIKRGARFIRPVFMTVVFLTLLRLVYANLTANG